MENQSDHPRLLDIHSPFGAPCCYKERVESTMDEARALKGEKHGTVVAADFQSAGRGRSGRAWVMNQGENLIFTIILHYGNIPACLTLKAGLALSLAVEDFAASVPGSPSLSGRVQVKWPNDLMILPACHVPSLAGRKAAGILAEASEGTVFLGVGVNLVQTSFPQELEGKAVSLLAALDPAAGPALRGALMEGRWKLLECILTRLFEELEPAAPEKAPFQRSGWKERLEARLYLKDKKVSFVPGPPHGKSFTRNAPRVEGILRGIGEHGELCIEREGMPLSFVSGELAAYG